MLHVKNIYSMEVLSQKHDCMYCIILRLLKRLLASLRTAPPIVSRQGEFVSGAIRFCLIKSGALEHS